MMNRRTLLSLSASAPLLASGCAAPSSLDTSAPPATALQGTGDLGVVIERAQGRSPWSTPAAARPSAASPAWATSRTPRWCSRAMSASPTSSAATAD